MQVTLTPKLVCASDEKTIWYNYIGQIESIAADINQVTRTEDHIEIQNSSGSMIFQRPNLLKWQVRKPNVQEIIVDGKYVWYYDKEISQVTRYNIKRITESSPIQFLMYDAQQIKRLFEVNSSTSDDGIKISLTPKTEHMYQKIDIYFSQNTLYKIEFIDKLSQTTQIKL